MKWQSGGAVWRVVMGWLLAVWLSDVAAQDFKLATDFMSMLGSLRPAKSVLRSVKAAAPELFISLSQRLESWGYSLEAHTVRTEDGYLLTVHRISRGRGSSPDAAPGPPVLLQHGLISCSELWIIAGPGISPALTLADRGYDVWINNIRGTHYSRKHEKMGRRDKDFWKFSFHEVGLYDLPAVIDYVLNATNQSKLFYVSHSMGNTAFFVMLSMRPQYNAKIRLHISLAPAVYLNETASVPAQMAAANADVVKAAIEALPTYEILPKTDSAIAVSYLLCNDKAYFNKLCAVLLSWIVGTMDLNDTSLVTMVLARSTSGTSAIVPWHLAQILRTGEFTQLDNGIAENLRAYGAPRPPRYRLEAVTVPVAMYAADADALVSSKGTERLSKVLPNVLFHKVIKNKFFNHLDFIIHPQLNELLMDNVLETMSRF